MATTSHQCMNFNRILHDILSLYQCFKSSRTKDPVIVLMYGDVLILSIPMQIIICDRTPIIHTLYSIVILTIDRKKQTENYIIIFFSFFSNKKCRMRPSLRLLNLFILSSLMFEKLLIETSSGLHTCFILHTHNNIHNKAQYL